MAARVTAITSCSRGEKSHNIYCGIRMISESVHNLTILSCGSYSSERILDPKKSRKRRGQFYRYGPKTFGKRE